MSYQFLPNAIFLLAVLGVLILILRRLPEAAGDNTSMPVAEPAGRPGPGKILNWLKPMLKPVAQRIWRFILEAKDIKQFPSFPKANFQKLFRPRPKTTREVTLLPKLVEETKDDKYYLQQINQNPNNLFLYDALSKIYIEQKKFQEAADLYSFLTTKEPYNAGFLAKFAFCCYNLRLFDKAAEYYQKSLAIDPTRPNRYYNLGLSLDAQGLWEESVTALNKAIELEPKNPKYYLLLNKVTAKLKDTTKTKAHKSKTKNNKI